MEIWQQTFALVLVFGLLGGALWLARNRRIPRLSSRAERRMDVIERVSLTPHHTLCLVKVGERLVMIGTAPSSCQLIDAFPAQGTTTGASGMNLQGRSA